MAIGTYISIIILNVNELNAPTKRHRVSLWTQKQDPCLSMLSTRDPVYVSKDKERQVEKYIPCKWEAKESWSSSPHVRQNRP